MKKIIYIVALFVISLNVQANNNQAEELVEYASSSYLNAQYQIIKNIFSKHDVTLLKNRDIRITLPVSYAFKPQTSGLTRPARDDLKVFASFMNKYPESVLSIHGHTDAVGSEKSNMTLSNKRAQLVYQQMAKNDISIYRLTTIGEGEEVPKCSNKTKRGRECNRRVELVLSLEPFLYK